MACFDTAFHAAMPAKASTYALPGAWRDRGAPPLRVPRAQPRLGQPPGGRAARAARPRSSAWSPPTSAPGASLAAVACGRSVDTTMGFTPIEGLVMATRSGSVDPGLVLWVQRHGGLTADEVEDALEHESGLRGPVGRVRATSAR